MGLGLSPEEVEELEAFVFGDRRKCPTLRCHGLPQRRGRAHRLLEEEGHWPSYSDVGEELSRRNQVQEPRGWAVEEGVREDLTHLEAWAIDEGDTSDPDDAISMDPEGFWVHIADVAARVPQNSELDSWARFRSSTLYFPSGPDHMLPRELTSEASLGEGGLALSVKLKISAVGARVDRICRSVVRVQRSSYEDQDLERRWRPWLEQTRKYSEIRKTRAMSRGHWPMVKVARGPKGEIECTKLPSTVLREGVKESMIAHGEALAHWCIARALPVLHLHQAQKEDRKVEKVPMDGDARAAWFSRRLLRSPLTSPDALPHWGLGVDAYLQATSPLRRYGDLVNQRQVVAFMEGRETMGADDLIRDHEAWKPYGESRRRRERESRRQALLRWLKENPGPWPALVLGIGTSGPRVLVLDLAMEVSLTTSASPGSTVMIKAKAVDPYESTCRFEEIP